jgi:hypothetical protein
MGQSFWRPRNAQKDAGAETALEPDCFLFCSKPDHQPIKSGILMKMSPADDKKVPRI